MFDNSVKRLGFACKFMHPDQTQSKKILEELQRPLTEKCTTVQWLNRQSRDVAEQRLWDIMVHNSAAAKRLVEYVGSLTPELRMVRLGSNQLPVYTQHEWSYFWKRTDVIAYLEKHYGAVGETARQLNVRLSMHPGQFCVLASDTPDIVNRSIDEFEYHADLARWMGYGRTFQDFKINVHISGRRGPQGIKDALLRLSPEARNCITIENDEMCWGLESSLELVDHCALVLDVHHHWIRDEEYISPTDERIAVILDSWRGVRPVMHYSYSRDHNLPGDNPAHDSLLDMQGLLSQGCKKQKLRAHSDYYPNRSVNDWALGFRSQFDIMCEAKAKNLATQQLYQQALANGQ